MVEINGFQFTLLPDNTIAMRDSNWVTIRNQDGTRPFEGITPEQARMLAEMLIASANKTNNQGAPTK